MLKLAPILKEVPEDIGMRGHEGSGSHDRQLHQALPFNGGGRIGPESIIRKSEMANHNRRVNKKLVPDTEEQYILLVMHALRQQRYSYERIAQKLAQSNLRNRNGNLFPWENIRAILTRQKKPATLRAMFPAGQKE